MAHPECPCRHPGFAVACFRGPLRSRPFGTAFGALPPAGAGRRRAMVTPASMPACPSLIRRLSVGRYAPAAVCSGSVSPQNSVGGETGRFALSGSGFAAFRGWCPPPVPLRGKRGELKGEKGSPVFRGCSLREPDTALPCLCRRFLAGCTVAAPVGHDITPQVIVDKFLDQCRAVKAHHGGVNVQPLRCLNG